MQSLEYFSSNLDRYLEDLRGLTEIESPTGDLRRLEQAAGFLEDRLIGIASVDREHLRDHGPLLRAAIDGNGCRVLLLGHFDTVWPVGSWPCLWKLENGRAHGPGIYDMKGGVLFMVWLLRYLADSGLPHPRIEALFNPDEEIGSPGSRSAIEEAARRADVVLVLEPTNLEGSLKLARKGSGEYVVTIHGRSSHQGVDPGNGVNAVVEAAHQVIALLELQDLELGSTIGPNVISGGSVSNVVPDRAEIRVDVRAWNETETARLDAAIRGLRPLLDGAQIHVFGGWNRPPMEASAASLELFEGTKLLGQALGLELDWVRWGGSSDANIAASVGAPTVDGFGPTGEGAHQHHESIVVDDVARRLALLAEVVTSLTHLETGREPALLL